MEKKYVSGCPETLDVTSDGIMRKGSIDNEGRRSVSEDITFQRDFLFCAFNSTNFSYYKSAMLLQTNFLFEKIYSSQFGLYKQYVLL
jgi:hypothetical protein